MGPSETSSLPDYSIALNTPIVSPGGPKVPSILEVETVLVGARNLVEELRHRAAGEVRSMVAVGEPSMAVEGGAKRKDASHMLAEELRTAAVDKAEETGWGTRRIVAEGGIRSLFECTDLALDNEKGGKQQDSPLWPFDGAPDCWFVLLSLFNSPSTWLLIFESHDISGIDTWTRATSQKFSNAVEEEK